MKSKYISLSLAMVAGVLCVSAFVIKISRAEAPDYMILSAGIFITALGIAAWFRKK